MDEKRREPRTHLIYYLRVFEPDTNNLFGHVVDISRHGVLITSDRPMEKDGLYRLEIEDVSSLDELSTVDVEVQCRWCQGDAANQLYDAGFQMVNPSPRMSAVLETYQ
ncbi:MAG: PilZ domain-containing protein [Pseudomonadota bacterium]|nr:hypothetical protein [Pseudomonadales bacterium]MDY6920723.1 PilZ domain-containing protein [Pseudomonadota bacterium]